MLNWPSFIGGLFTSGLVLGLFVWLLRQSIVNLLKVDAEKQIDEHAQRLKHDLQKEMLKTELATNQKHKVYAELHALLMKADGAVGSLRGLGYAPTYEEYNKEDFEKHLQDFGVKKGKIDEIMKDFTSDRRRAISNWESYRRILEQGKARITIAEAKNFWIINYLYVSKNVSDLVQQLTNQLAKRLIFIEGPLHDGKDVERETKLEGEVTEQLARTKAAMMQELHPSAS